MSEINRETLLANFDFLGVKPADKVVEKCLALCNEYDLNTEEIVDLWCAYAASTRDASEPTVEALDNIERKQLAKRKKFKNVGSNFANNSPKTPSRVANNRREIDAGEELLNSYEDSTPKRNKSVKRVRSPDTLSTPPRQLNYQSPGTTFSPITYRSSGSAENTNFLERTDSGTVLKSFGPDNLVKSVNFTRKSDISLDISLWGDQENHLSANAPYMFEVLRKKAYSVNNMTNYLVNCLRKKYSIEELQSFTTNKMESMVTCGRICCDSDGKLNASSVLLEETIELSNGQTVPLNLKRLPAYSLFPGQVVLVQGDYLHGSGFVANTIYSDATSILPASPENLREPLQVVVAAGPFTLTDNLLYQPLEDLIKHVLKQKPHALILVGPFVDSTHQNVCDGSMVEPFDKFFQHLIDKIVDELKDCNIQIVLVSSHKDAHHHPVYPTPPYKLSKKYPNVHCFPDPSLISINGVVIGVTSSDPLFHIGREEISTGLSDRFKRLASHILSQQSFYPLYPPSSDVNVDHTLLEKFGMLEITPHILILPSNFTYFAKAIGGCVVVNPERLAKGFAAGAFSRFEIYPTKSSCLSDDLVCQIVRV